MNIEKVLYNLQRFQIIQARFNSTICDSISDAYVYAWSENLFPVFSDDTIHQEFENQFKIRKEDVIAISEYADKNWLQKIYFSFYKYEEKFQDIDRHSLIAIFRYMFLQGMFDDNFWSALLENGKCPVEAFGIKEKFDLQKLSLI